MSHPRGESVHFVFAEGESWGRPDPGVHIKMDERLMMVDAEGWATTSDPVYYDLYVGDGTRRRFLATNMTGALGALVSITDAKGMAVTPEQMGVDIVYDSNGVRQFLTPSRLADIVQTADFSGYDIAVYAIDAVPAKDAATGLYAPPAAMPVKRLSLRSANGGKRAIVTIRRGGGEPMVNVFDYAMGEWSLTRPSGVKEEKERLVQDKKAAQIVKEVKSPFGELLSRRESNFKWMSWGFAMTNRVEGFGGVTDTTTWTYYTSGNGKGQVKTEKRQSGLLIQYAYDNLDRLVSQTRSGPGMMTEVTTYDYTPVDPSDPVLPVDTRPRTIVRKLNNIECERTYYVYSPLTNIVERVGTQGAAYGGTNVLRTVTAFYPVVANDARSGFVQSIRHEDGKLDLYDYELASNCWVRTVTHLHEQSPSLVSGKTSRDITITNARGETSETRTEAYIDGIWYTIARNRMTYNAEGKRTSLENLAGQVTTTAWDCCHKVSEVQPDGSTTTWDYDDDGRMIASSRLIPLDMTNVTWLTTCYEYDALGRQTATWQTNFAAQVGLPVERTRYDALGRVIARVDTLGEESLYTYSADSLIATTVNPNGSVIIISHNMVDERISVSGTAVAPEFRTIGILSNGTRILHVVRGATPESSRFKTHYQNMLKQVAREEESGFCAATLVTVNEYDAFGRLVCTTSDYEPTTEYTYDTLGNRVATTRSNGNQWRKNETRSSFVLYDAAIWLAQTNSVFCSDSTIAPLVTSSARQLTGLTSARPSRSHSYDIRDNMSENETLVETSFVTIRQTVPYATNKPFALSRYGVSLMNVSVSAVTNTVAYDTLGRKIAHTDGRGNTQHTEYNALGQRAAFIDALGNRTSYAYDQFGNLVAVTNPLGHAIVYEYDLRNRRTYEGGATYPVRYTYDVFGNKTTMTTYRNESLGPGSGDVTTWLYDEASNCKTNKVYADGLGPTYEYDAKGNLTKRTWARGVETFYAYDGWGNLTNTSYSDNTSEVALSYDVMGRLRETRDAAGVTTFAYDECGSLTNETVVGAAGTNVIERFYDAYGRSLGYALNGERRTALSYEPDKGRISSMLAAGSTNEFRWAYLPCSDLKESLEYPNGDVVRWEYEPKRDLLTLVSNAMHSVYRYAYDAAGRRVSKNDERYSYNMRNELTLATNVVTGVEFVYCYDDMGNRMWSREFGTNTTYVANCLNQYTNIVRGGVVEYPSFDADGNQTGVTTSTGHWLVEYNGENRPIRWVRNNKPNTQGITNRTIIVMSYDHMGRRVVKNEETFICNDYLNISETIWDPTEPVATQPLESHCGENIAYYMHDGNKNISDVIGNICQNKHFVYAPFGAQLGTFGGFSGWGFSSEYIDAELDISYYNYRHLKHDEGRWMTRDQFEEIYPEMLNRSTDCYLLVSNNPISMFDLRGLDNPGCDIVGAIPGWESDCRLACCAKHDECYDKNNCTAWSWFNPLNPFSCPSKCDDCNAEVVACTLACFKGHDPIPRPWEPPRPGGGKYYCAATHTYVADPKDCPKNSKQ